jgi:hypothetical protein
MNSVVADKKQHFFRRCWSGSARLWQAYWLVGVLGQFVVLFLAFAITYPFWRGPQDNLWSTVVFLVLMLVYVVFASVSVWRCAPNANNQVWGALARTLVVLSLLCGAVLFWRAL